MDAWASIEQSRLSWIRHNQATIRQDSLAGALEGLNEGLNPQDIGRRTILPSTFPEGPRARAGHFQDAMAIVRSFGKPDYFITFTANPNWQEIHDELLPGQAPHDRPDLISRVFELKLKSLRAEIEGNKKTGGAFGKVMGHVGVVEYQKRGLPHAHILLILDPADRPKSTSDIDAAISAEIPDPQLYPYLYRIVTGGMLHGKCGPRSKAPCLKNGVCTKNFPRPLATETTIDTDGYPRYRRRGRFNFEKDQFKYTDADVVPYNPYLTAKYNAHINVENCGSILAPKYLFKYVHKGEDRATVTISNADGSEKGRDEVKEYVDGRYISAPQGEQHLTIVEH